MKWVIDLRIFIVTFVAFTLGALASVVSPNRLHAQEVKSLTDRLVTMEAHYKALADAKPIDPSKVCPEWWTSPDTDLIATRARMCGRKK